MSVSETEMDDLTRGMMTVTREVTQSVTATSTRKLRSSVSSGRRAPAHSKTTAPAAVTHHATVWKSLCLFIRSGSNVRRSSASFRRVGRVPARPASLADGELVGHHLDEYLPAVGRDEVDVVRAEAERV